jgi:hypothetical protein
LFLDSFKEKRGDLALVQAAGIQFIIFNYRISINYAGKAQPAFYGDNGYALHYPKEKMIIVTINYSLVPQQPFLLPQDEEMPHGHILLFLFLNPSFSVVFPMLPGICPAYTAPSP